MNGRVKKLSSAAAIAVLLVGAGACSRPDEDAPTRVTGDKTAANPAFTTDAPTTTEAPEAPSTTRYYSPEGPGANAANGGAADEQDNGGADADVSPTTMLNSPDNAGDQDNED